MNAVTHSSAPTLDNDVDFTSALVSVVQRIQNEILISVQNDAATILLTGQSGKGKSILLRTIGTKVAANGRLIFLNGSDLFKYNSDVIDSNIREIGSNPENDFATIKNFIQESAKLGEALTIIVDKGDCLSTEILIDLFDLINEISLTNKHVSLILGGQPNLKERLNKIKSIDIRTVVQCSLDDLNDNDIRLFSAKKNYHIKPINGDLQFDHESLLLLTEHTNGNLKCLNVLLEWCSLVANENETHLINSEIVKTAITKAKNTAEKTGISITDCFPFLKDVEKITSYDTTDNKRQTSNSSFVQTATAIKATSIPLHAPEIPANTTDKLGPTSDQNSDAIPTLRTPSLNTPVKNNRSSITFRSFAPLIIIILSAIIFFQLQPFITSDESNNSSPSLDNNTSSNNTLIEDTVDNEVIDLNSPQAEAITIENSKEIIFDSPAETLNKNDIHIKDNSISDNAEEQKNLITNASLDGTAHDPQILHLLKLASEQFTTKNLTTPAGNNALETYQLILAKHPHHTKAKQGIIDIHDRYISWANYYKANNDIKRSAFFLAKAQKINLSSIKQKEELNTLEKISAYSAHESSTDAIDKKQTPNKQKPNLLIDNLLIKAKQQLKSKNLTSPPNDNAFETYMQVLKSEPDNAIALHGLFTIKKSYIHWAEQDLKKNNRRRAALFYKKALAVDPGDIQLAQRLEEIESSEKH